MASAFNAFYSIIINTFKMLKHTFPDTAHQPDEKFMVFVLIQEVNL